MNTIIILSCLGLVTMFTGVYHLRKLILPLVVAGLLAGLAANYFSWNTDISYYNNMLHFDNYAVAFTGLLIAVSIVVFFVSDQQYRADGSNVADIYALILFTLVGGIIMVSYSNLTMLFIGIEALSIPLYVLAGSKKLNLESNEASLKYFLMGSFSTGFLLFGIALMYGTTGSFDLLVIKNYVVNNADALPLIFKAGLFLMMIGLLFKVSAVPFHFWAPDVYSGSPTLVTTFMATVVKTAGFAAIFRLFYICFGAILHEWFYTIWAVTALTITVGNLSAIRQTSVKRMLAYSSISNAGFLLMGVLALNENAASAMLYYTAAYSLSTICAFAVVMLVEQVRGNSNYESFHGLARSNPLFAGIMTLALLSLAGIPPLAGFFGKYFLFANSIDNGYIWIVIIAVLNSLLGIYYYFKVIVAMLAKEPAMEKIETRASYVFILVAAALAIVILGVFPNLLTGLL
ncbi:MAG: NADH-quinone oxidoreductase subunit N [Sphingobacteriales bacterium]|nr:MAG: NADH-quinone oxidoreductase subunit N [Sphingobacteriales bacterium]